MIKKKKPYRHVTILEESYNADRQAQEMEKLKSTLKQGAKKIGCGCLSLLVIIPAVLTVGSLLASFFLHF